MHYTHPAHTPLCSSICCWSTLASSSHGCCIWRSSLCASIHSIILPCSLQNRASKQIIMVAPKGQNISNLQNYKVNLQSTIYNPQSTIHSPQSTMCEGQSAIYILTILNPQSAPCRGIRNTAGTVCIAQES